MNDFKFRSDSEPNTRKLGIQIGQVLREGMVIALNGTLGTGKTTLTKSIAEGVGVEPENVNSPTFTLCVPHHGRLSLLHVDAYRIENLIEVDQLGLDEWVEDGGVLIVEWAEKISKALPQINLTIVSKHDSDTGRSYHLLPNDLIGQTAVETIRTALSQN